MSRVAPTVRIESKALPAARMLAWVIAGLMLAACSSLRTYVHVDGISPTSTLAADEISIATSGKLSRYTRELLSQLQLRWQPERCDSILRSVERAHIPETLRRFASAELALASAGARGCGEPHGPLLLGAARDAHTLLTLEAGGDQGPPGHLTLQLYNRAVARLLTGPVVDRRARAASFLMRSQELQLPIQRDSLELAMRFDRLVDSDSLEITGLAERHRRFGAGAALIGVVSARKVAFERQRSMEGVYATAVTALVKFDAAGTATLALHDSSDASVCLAGKAVPLNADFTAPYAWLLSRTDQRLIGLLGAFLPQRAARQRGLILLEPFDPHKIPVLMIHGFGSSPQAWRNITNDILASPELRHRFQVWHYIYPTGLNYLYSAGVLRTELAGFLAQLRKDYGADSALPLIVIGHSQGGLMARALVTRSDTRLWDLLFKVPPQSLKVDPVMREIFRNTLLFEPLPDVQAVVFMATPNSGMSSKDNPLVAWLLNVLIDLPDDAAHALRRLQREHPEQLHKFARRWFSRGGITAVESVAVDNPLMQTFARLPLAQGPHYHSIVAVRSNGKRIDDGDGYVSRSSAHVPEAESELIVHGGHRDTDGVEVIAELRRILRAHAQRAAATSVPEQTNGPCTMQASE